MKEEVAGQRNSDIKLSATAEERVAGRREPCEPAYLELRR